MSEIPDPLPSYDELPEAPGGGRSAWGLFGEKDRVGLFNLVTAEVTRAAATLARRGAVFSLNAPNDFLDPPLFERPPLKIEKQQVRGGHALNEVYSDFNPQSSSQWDALSHVSFAAGRFYNGATLEEVLAGERNTVDAWAERGIVTRGVLLDLERTAAAEGREYDPLASHAFSVEDLERARAAAGVELRTGDVLLLRTGFMRRYAELPAAERERISNRAEMTACGIEHTEDMARYLWDSHIAAAACDCPALEVWPMDYSPELFPFGCLHQMILGQFGMAIGELFALDELAADCAADGVHEVLFTSAPLNTRGGFGSTANALAVK
ncbi:MAG: cyclase family protein [Actinobacteria bacterium]|nr:cyclase family protein [Actinomycetota bacterium]